MTARSNGHVTLPTPLKDFPRVDTAEHVIRVLTVGEALRLQRTFDTFNAAQAHLKALGEEWEFDPFAGNFQLEDDGRLIHVSPPTAPVDSE